MTKLALAALATAFLGTSAQASGLEGLFQTDMVFASAVNEAVTRYEAKDVLRETPECAFLDYKYFRQFDLIEAVTMLQPCMEGVSRRSGMNLKAEAGMVRPASEEAGPVMGVVIKTGEAPIASQGMRNLSYSLKQRNWELLGHPVLVRRASDEEAAKKSAAQESLDSCLLTTVLRKIESGADFIRAYGRCITSDANLKVKELRPAPGRELGVLALSSASEVVVAALNGTVSVNAENGLVTVLIIAYPETYSLPK